MPDIIPYVAGILAETGAQVELSYNEISAHFPLLILTETNNTSRFVSGGVEYYSEITLQVDVYDLTDQAVREMAARVSELLISHGMKRTGSVPIREQNMKRIALTFQAGVNHLNEIGHERCY